MIPHPRRAAGRQPSVLLLRCVFVDRCVGLSGLLLYLDILPGPDDPGRGYGSPPGLNRGIQDQKHAITRDEHKWARNPSPAQTATQGLRPETTSAGAVRPRKKKQIKKARRADKSIPNIRQIKFNLMLLQKI